jgi:O-antigen/teichoic acid export membrane protein
VQAGLLFLLLPSFGTIGGAWATLCGSLAAVLLTGWGVLRPAPMQHGRPVGLPL